MLTARAVAVYVDACESSEWQCKSDIRQDLYMRSLNFCLLTGNSRNITGIWVLLRNLIGVCVLGLQVVLKKRQKESILLHFDCISRY